GDDVIFNHYRGPAATPAKAAEEPERRFLAPPEAPLEVAEEFFATTYVGPDGNKTLYRWRGSWWRWETTHWREIEDSEMRAQIYRYTRDAVCLGENGLEEWAPTDRKVSAVLDALVSVCLLPATTEQPCWLDGRTDGGVLIPCANGLY